MVIYQIFIIIIIIIVIIDSSISRCSYRSISGSCSILL